MSGTSLDGVDIAHCTFKKNKNWTYKIDKAKTIEYPSRLKKKLKSSSKIVESRKKNFSYTISSKKLGKIYKTMTVQKTINTFAI